jgi:transposase
VDTLLLAEKGPIMDSKRPHSYPLKFKSKITELARAKHNLDKLACEFQLAGQTVRNWVKRDGLDAGLRSDGRTSNKRVDLVKLR